MENLLEAWREFLRGKRGKRDVQEFGLRLMDNLFKLHRDLMRYICQHGGYESFNISDPKPRHIHKASVRDRLLHHAVYRVLYPCFDRTFIADSFSCRIGKGTHRALNRFRAFGYKASRNHTRTCWVLQCDIRKCFASIDHQTLLCILSHRLDADTLWLVEEIIRSFHSGTPGVGLPLGNLTSQLFVNAYLNEFDQFVKHTLKTKYYLRYADDFIILSVDRFTLEKLLPHIQLFLRERLGLDLHPRKVFIRTFASGIDFLGWVHFPDYRRLRTTTKRRLLKRVRERPTSETIASYRGLLKHGNAWKVRREAGID